MSSLEEYNNTILAITPTEISEPKREEEDEEEDIHSAPKLDPCELVTSFDTSVSTPKTITGVKIDPKLTTTQYVTGKVQTLSIVLSSTK